MILYELLTGRLPADPARIGHVEFLSRLARGEIAPPRPSARTGRELAGDLDWIVLKALDPDRARRYDTALALAEDLERYARDEPVSARPPSAWYRARKFVARNTLAVGAAGAVLAAIVAGAGIAAWQARVAIAERKRAEEVNEFIASIFRDADPYEGSGKTLTAADLLKQAKARIDRTLKNRPELRVELLNLVGRSLLNLQDTDAAEGVIVQALEEANRSLGPHVPQTLRARVLMAEVDRFRGRTEKQGENLATLLPLLRRDPAASPEDLVEALANKAHLAIDEGRFGEAEAAAKEAFEVSAAKFGERHPYTVALTGLMAISYLRNQKPDLAMEAAERRYRLNFELHGHNPKDPRIIDARAGYAGALAEMDRLDEANEQIGQAVADAAAVFGPESTMVGFFSGRLADYRQEAGEIRLALRAVDDNLRIITKLSVPDSFTHAAAVARHGTVLLAARREEEALAELTIGAQSLKRAVGPSHERVYSTEAARALALGYCGRLPEGRQEIERSLVSLRAGGDPGVANALYVLGVLQRLGADHGEALRTQEAALGAIPPGPKAARRRMRVLAEIGADHVELGAHDRGVPVLVEALALFEKLEKRTTPNRADALIALGRAKLAQGLTAEALPSLAEADRFWSDFHPGSRWAGEAALWLGRCYSALGRPGEARSALARARVLSNSPFPGDREQLRLAQGR